MKLSFFTKTLIVIYCILTVFIVFLAIAGIWELLPNDLINKLFLTSALLFMLFIIPTVVSIKIDEINNEL